MFMVGYLLLLIIRLLLDSKTFDSFATACCRKYFLVYCCILGFHVMFKVEQQKLNLGNVQISNEA